MRKCVHFTDLKFKFGFFGFADDNERLVRRVSYLKATSSPIDMDRKSVSPTSPTLRYGLDKMYFLIQLRTILNSCFIIYL